MVLQFDQQNGVDLTSSNILLLTTLSNYKTCPQKIVVFIRGPQGKALWRYWVYFRAWKRNLMKIIALLRDELIWHPAWLGKLGVNVNFRQFLCVICAKNLRESGISSYPWGAPLGISSEPQSAEYSPSLKTNVTNRPSNAEVMLMSPISNNIK